MMMMMVVVVVKQIDRQLMIGRLSSAVQIGKLLLIIQVQQETFRTAISARHRPSETEHGMENSIPVCKHGTKQSGIYSSLTRL